MAGSTAQGSLRSDPHSYERRRTHGPEPRRRVGMHGAALVRIPNPYAKSEATPSRPFVFLFAIGDSPPGSRPPIAFAGSLFEIREPAGCADSLSPHAGRGSG